MKIRRKWEVYPEFIDSELLISAKEFTSQHYFRLFAERKCYSMNSFYGKIMHFSVREITDEEQGVD